MPIETPSSAERLNPRELLRKEFRDSLAFHEVPEDTLAYGHAASAVRALLERGFSAADGVEKELKRQDGLKDGDPKKMGPEERKRYEDMLTQVETWALTLPEMLRQARVVQHEPEVQRRLTDVFNLVGDREEFLKNLETMRFIVLKGSDKNPGSPFDGAMPRELYELAAIATVSWMVRERIQIHPDMLDPAKAADKKVYEGNVEALADTEIEGGWTADAAMPVDKFLITKSGARFLRPSAADGYRRGETVKKIFAQGRVKVNGVTEKDPTRALKAGDAVTVTTVFGRSTELTGAGIEAARVDVDATRRTENAERATQNLPAVEAFAYDPSATIGVWKRLLASPGAPERQRYARQLREGVADFKRDFLERKAVLDFLKTAKEEKDRVVGKNERAKELVKMILWVAQWVPGGTDTRETVAERMTTSPEEFDRVFNEVSAELTKRFDAFATPERMKQTDDLLAALDAVEKGGKVDREALDALIDAYAGNHREIGGALVRFQSWQVRENVMRVGGTGRANNLDLVTRYDNKSSFQMLRSLAPYGAFQTSSYVDEKTGRLILVDNGPSFSGQGVLGHAWETTKLGVETGLLSATLAHIVTRIPYLSRIPYFSRFMGSVAVPVALAEAQMALTKEMARQERVVLAGTDVQQCVEALQELQKRHAAGTIDRAEAARVATILGTKLRYELVVLLHAATRHEPTDRRPDLMLEAHVYTNQLLTAAGLPPMSTMADGFVPTSVAELKKQVKDGGYAEAPISPEVERYIVSREADRQSQRSDAMKGTRDKLSSLRETIRGPRKDPAESLRRGIVPDAYSFGFGDGNEKIRQVKSARDEMKLDEAIARFGTGKEAAVKESYVVAGTVFDLYRKFGQMNRDMRATLGRNPVAKDLQDDLNREFRMADGTRFRSYDLIQGTNDLVGRYSLNDIRAAAKVLEANAPQDVDIAEHWLRQGKDSVGSSSVTKYLADVFGGPASRGPFLSEKLIQQWLELYGVRETELSRVSIPAYRVGRDMDFSRFESNHGRLFTLPDGYWMEAQPEYANGKFSAIGVRIGQNTGKGDGSFRRQGVFELDGKRFECTEKEPRVMIDLSLIRPDSTVRVLAPDGKELTKKVPLLFE